MSLSLTFHTLYKYNTAVEGIEMPVQLSVGNQLVIVPDAKLDTGSTFCIFEQGYCASLGLTLENGYPQRIETAMGTFLSYGHEVSLLAMDCEFTTTVFFAALPGFFRNVLGRRGWLDRLRLGVVDYDGELYASLYNETA